MKGDQEKIRNGLAEIHELCEAQGRVLRKTIPYRLALDSARKVRAIRNTKSPEAARLKARLLALEYEDWLELLGMPTELHGFDEDHDRANRAPLDLSNHPHGVEANGAFARYDEDTAQRVSIVLKDSLTRMPFKIGKGVQALDPIVVNRPKISKKRKPSREEVKALRSATKSTGEATRDRIQAGQKVMTFIEGTREEDGSLLKFQSDLVRPSFDHFETTDTPALIVVKTALINGAFPHKYEAMINPLAETPVYQTPIHHFRKVLDVSGQTVDDVLAETRRIMTQDLLRGIDMSLETLSS